MDSTGIKTRRKGIVGKLKAVNHDMWSVVILVSIILGSIFIIFPFSKLFFNSFVPKGESTVSFANYVTFLSKKYYRIALLNSLKVSVLTTILSTCLGVPLAYLSSRYNIYLKKIINTMVVLSMLSPPFIGAYSWILLLGRNGFITNILSAIGIEIGSIYGFKGIILVFTLKLFPFVYMYSSAALGAIDASLEEAAENLGVHGIKKLLTVTFPLIMPTILSSALMVFMTSLADFGTPMLIGEGYKVLPVAIYEEFMSEVGGDISFASALSVL